MSWICGLDGRNKNCTQKFCRKSGHQKTMKKMENHMKQKNGKELNWPRIMSNCGLGISSVPVCILLLDSQYATF